jgi:diguanylate cyclase (GGDEF)-like protein
METNLLFITAVVALALYLLVLVLENKRLREENKRWKHAARVDPVTGALNRAGFNNLFERSVARANNAASPSWIAVLLLDVDNFKQINDAHGHPVGDMVLRFIAEIARARVRPTDAVARIGGDELAIVLPGADKNVVARIGRDVHNAVRSTQFQLPDGRYINISVSTGGASKLGPDVSLAELTRIADDRLYASKNSRGSGDHEAVVDSVRREP